MGTHPNGPSTVVGGFGQTLSEWIKEQPSSKAGADSLPFLLKVLSVNKPLSIQAHPTKSHAVELNKQDADTYKDPNHKPELSVALSPFEALLGFRPVDQLKLFFKTVPELSEVIGEEAVGEFSKSEGDATDPLKTCFNNLMTAEQKKVETALHKLLKRADEETRKVQLAELVERLHEGYPGDVGVFGPYLFNYIQMRPGEAIYIPPNEPHAYLSGDCMECMACSDNVVRAGLTPKPKDVPTLVNMLTYLCESAESKIFSPENEDDYTVVFRPPVEDFALARINVRCRYTANS
ncbi:hypothetical protein AAG570_006194 [Ranatra chinensis]|uniref:mannose-6-phosphate isomerase n=1 Tax=Ranatra chinensis TaxID=642074 RepID=A0ABD0XZ25_9HEMI